MEHTFTVIIKDVLQKYFDDNSVQIFERNHLIQYINEKTRSANRGSKSRGSFGALYSIYTLLEDYIEKGFIENNNYFEYEGSRQTPLIKRQRELPFGNKLQNHYFQNRTNTDYRKFFPAADSDKVIIHDQTESKYWINEALLKIDIDGETINLAKAIMQIIDEYIKTKQDSFHRFIENIEELQRVGETTPNMVEEFILSLLAPNVDARLFEIVSYSILKYFYFDQQIIWGYEMDSLNTEKLKLYKTGRTNANDGGIDFVMKPLGRFFQVTETLDFKKYFLDIDKIQKYPLTFVIKSTEQVADLIIKIKENAIKIYPVSSIIEKYMLCIEEVINIPILQIRFNEAVTNGYLISILNEIIIQSKVEFNYIDEE